MVADTATWGTERIVAAKPTQTVSLSGCEFSFDRPRAEARPELQRVCGKVHRAQRRCVDRYYGALDAQFLCPWHGGADVERAGPTPSVARRQ